MHTEKYIVAHIGAYVKKYFITLCGVTLAIGSVGLILGGVTMLLTVLLLIKGFPLLVAMIGSFFIVGIGGLFIGGLIAYLFTKYRYKKIS